jgi:hypothetical protein
MRVVYLCALTYPKVGLASLKSRGLTNRGRIRFTEESSRILVFNLLNVSANMQETEC